MVVGQFGFLSGEFQLLIISYRTYPELPSKNRKGRLEGLFIINLENS